MTKPRFTPLSLWNQPAKGEPLEWEWARSRLADARDYWVTTVSPSGRPVSRPVWGAWVDDELVLTIGSTTHWANFRNNPEASINLPDTTEVVIVEGKLRPDDSEARRARLIEVYNPKYEWNFTLETLDWVIVVEPRVVMAWVAGPPGVENQDSFPTHSGRWEF